MITSSRLALVLGILMATLVLSSAGVSHAWAINYDELVHDTNAPTTATVGATYTYVYTPQGGATSSASIADGPSWLTFTWQTNTFSGTPTAAGSYLVQVVEVVDGYGITILVYWYINVTANDYTVTFNSDGGSGVAPKTVTAGDPYGALPISTKSGYTFDGWYLGSTKVTPSMTPSSDVTLVAHWIPNVIQYTAPSGGNLAVGTLWSNQLSTTPGVAISISGASTSWIHANGGQLSGVPTSAGIYEVTVTLTAPNYISMERTFTLTVVPQFVVTNSPAAGAIAYVVI